MKKKGSLVLFILWLIAGIMVLIAGPNRFTYGCVWILLLINYLIEAFVGDYWVGYKKGARDGVKECRKILNEVVTRKKQEELDNADHM